MNQIVASTTAATYRRIVKPMLFTQSPDSVHHGLVKTGAVVQRLPLVRAAMSGSWAYRHPALVQEVAGITFQNPVGLAAGFDKNFELAPLMRAVGFGYMEGGSLTFEVCPGNPRPWFFRLPKSQALVVNAGLANQGAKRIVHRIKQYRPAQLRQFPINISVAKTNSAAACSTEAAIADYVGSLRLIQEAGVGQMVTLNISCPNTFDGQPFTTPDRLEALLAAADELNMVQPLFIKMPAHLPWPEFKELVGVAARHRIKGLTIANLIYRHQAALKDILPESVSGKIGGRPNFEISNMLIRQTRREFGNQFVIIGVGGIFTGEDAYTKIKLGANLVQIITGLIYQGPSAVGQINRELVQMLERDGFDNISQAVGADLK